MRYALKFYLHHPLWAMLHYAYCRQITSPRVKWVGSPSPDGVPCAACPALDITSFSPHMRKNYKLTNFMRSHEAYA
jgi:hypothetical protein